MKEEELDEIRNSKRVQRGEIPADHGCKAGNVCENERDFAGGTFRETQAPGPQSQDVHGG